MSKDYALAEILTPPSPDDSGTTIVVKSGQGAYLGTPSGSYRASIYDPKVLPTFDKVEEVLVTARSTDTFTITRAQNSTAALHIAAGMVITRAVYDAEIPKTQDDLADGVTYKQYSATEQTKLAGIAAGADVTSATNVGSSIHGATGKTTPVDADELALIDSAASNVLKKLTWANLKATLKTYFDTLYQAAGSYLTASSTDTLTNKRITARVSSSASTATLTPDADSYDQYHLTAQAAALTVASPSGTPTTGQKLLIRIKDNGTAQTITWNAIYRSLGALLPTTTVVGKIVYVGLIYNAADTKWDCVAVAQEG